MRRRRPGRLSGPSGYRFTDYTSSRTKSTRVDPLLAPFVFELTYLVEARPRTWTARILLQDSVQDLDRSRVVAELHIGLDQHYPSLYRCGVVLEREREQRKRFLREPPCVKQAYRQPLQMNLIDR